jgi:hypothetical protein
VCGGSWPARRRRARDSRRDSAGPSVVVTVRVAGSTTPTSPCRNAECCRCGTGCAAVSRPARGRSRGRPSPNGSAGARPARPLGRRGRRQRRPGPPAGRTAAGARRRPARRPALRRCGVRRRRARRAGVRCRPASRWRRRTVSCSLSRDQPRRRGPRCSPHASAARSSFDTERERAVAADRPRRRWPSSSRPIRTAIGTPTAGSALRSTALARSRRRSRTTTTSATGIFRPVSRR